MWKMGYGMDTDNDDGEWIVGGTRQYRTALAGRMTTGLGLMGRTEGQELKG